MAAEAYDDELERLLIALARARRTRSATIEGRREATDGRGGRPMSHAVTLRVPAGCWRSRARARARAQDARRGARLLAARALHGGDRHARARAAQRQPVDRGAARCWSAPTPIGRYDDAERAARRGAASGGAGSCSTRSARSSWRGGAARPPRARSCARRDACVGQPHGRALNLAVLHYDRGDRETAMREFDRFIDVYNARGGRTSPAASWSPSPSPCELPRCETNPELFKDALKAYDRAHRRSTPTNVDARDGLGELFLRQVQRRRRPGDLRRRRCAVNPNDPRALAGRGPAADGRRTSRASTRCSRARWRSIRTYVRRAGCCAREVDCSISSTTPSAQTGRSTGRCRESVCRSHALAVAAAHQVPRGRPGRASGAAPARAVALNPHNARVLPRWPRSRAASDATTRPPTSPSRRWTPIRRHWRATRVLGMNLLRLGRDRRRDARVSRPSFAGDPVRRLDQEHPRPARHIRNYDADVTSISSS